MNILLIGPPGSGKGTQGARAADALGLELAPDEITEAILALATADAS